MKKRIRLAAIVLTVGISAASAANFDLTDSASVIETGHAAIRNDAFLQATNIFEQALLANPDHPAMHYHLGIAYYKSGRHEDAVARLQQALELSPDDAESYYAVGVVYLAWSSEHRLLKRGTLVKSAIQHFETAIQLAPNHIAAHYYLIQILINAPSMAGGDKARGAELNTQLRALSSMHHQVVISALATQAGDNEIAERLLMESHRADPSQPMLNYSLLSYYHSQQQCEKAIDFGHRFLVQPKEWDDSDSGSAHLLLAECQRQLGNRQQSLQHYAAALTYNKSERIVLQVQAAVQEIEDATEL